MVQDTDLFRNSNIGTRMRERFTNAFSQQDRTLLRLQNKRRHCGHLKFYFFLRETLKLNAFVLHMILNFYEISYINQWYFGNNLEL